MVVELILTCVKRTIPSLCHCHAPPSSPPRDSQWSSKSWQHPRTLRIIAFYTYHLIPAIPTPSITFISDYLNSDLYLSPHPLFLSLSLWYFIFSLTFKFQAHVGTLTKMASTRAWAKPSTHSHGPQQSIDKLLGPINKNEASTSSALLKPIKQNPTPFCLVKTN